MISTLIVVVFVLSAACEANLGITDADKAGNVSLHSEDGALPISSSACSSDPCMNGAMCRNIGKVDFLCFCSMNYYGRNCENALPCTDGPCQNGGTCQMLDRMEYSCTCAQGYWGNNCEHAYPCTSGPCQNGGTCFNSTITDYTCTCPSGYYGEDCENPMPCTNNTCENGGICENLNTTDFNCSCTEEYYGKRCERPMPCTNNPCRNDGNCSNMNIIKFVCDCPDTYRGERCETPMPCTNAPCKNGGSCTNVNITNYQCSCSEKYFGQDCENPMPCNDVTCQHGGTCVDISTADFRCDCPPEKHGRYCKQDVKCNKDRQSYKDLYGLHAEIDGFGYIRQRKYHNYGYRRYTYENIYNIYNYGDSVTCECNHGYRIDNGVCQAKCVADEVWELVHPCIPVSCGPPPIVEHASPSPIKDNETVYGAEVKYTCNEGYYSPSDNIKYFHPFASYTCRVSGNSGHWKDQGEIFGIGSYTPYCIRVPNCYAPPAVENGKVKETNSTLEFGQALYECDEGSTMIGDGIARCWLDHTSEFDGYDIRNLKWMYVPQCNASCKVPDGKTGNKSTTIVKITRCNSNSFAKYPDEKCGTPSYYHVTANVTNEGQSMIYYGDELCVARMYTKKKTRLSLVHRKCVSFCLPGHKGYKRLLISETLNLKDYTMIGVEREYLKFETLDNDKY